MSANSRWPDISRVSSIFNPFGSKASAGEASDANTDNEAQSDLNGSASARNGAAPFEMMTDIHGQPIDGMGGFDDHYNEDAPGDMDADFPPLEMFDSNAAEAPFSSMNAASFDTNNAAPTASMTVDEPETVTTKKSKKDKKKKKKDAEVQQPHEEGAHKRAKRKSSGEDEAPIASDLPPAGSIELGEEPLPSVQQSKRKRKGSDTADGKRKKRKSQAVTSEAVEEAVEDDGAGTFLRKDPKSGPAQLAVAVEEDVTGESDLQRSPTVAHLRRRSHSRSREPSSAPQNQIDSQEVENVARQAWDEHLNGNQENGESADVPMPDATANDQTQNDDDQSIKKDPGTPAKRVSTRKKAKPTFFDQPPPEDALPSAAAMTPKPRKRAKPATKKQKPERPKLSQSMLGGGDEARDPDEPKRKNRMEGFTKGRFSDEEMERLGKQIQDFGKENDMTPYQVNEMIHEPGGTQAGALHSQLWSRLIAECPDRHRQKIINIVRKKFHNYVARGTWTPEQEEELRRLIDQHGQSWSKIGGIINRHPEDIRDRFRNYVVCGDKQRKDTWQQHEEGELTQHIIASMASIDELRAMQPSRKLLQKSYEELIDWQNISELMGRTRSRLQCITKWKAMNLKTHGKDQFTSLQPDSEITFDLEKARRQLVDMPAAERYRMILAIAKGNATTDNKISWSKLCDRPWRLEWQRKTQVLLWHRLKKTVPSWERMSTRDVAQYLADIYDQRDELPDVDGEDYNDVEEMQVLKTLAAPHARSGAASQKKSKSTTNVSADKLTGSDLEDDEEALEEQGEQELQIDPALVSAIEQAADATKAAEAATAEEAAAAVDEIPSKKTPTKKTATYGKKRGSAKKNPTPAQLSQDPIEDSTDPSQELPELPPAETQEEFKDPAPKKKRAAKGKGAKGRKRGAKSTEVIPEGVSSDMEDMEDLPAAVEEAE